MRKESIEETLELNIQFDKKTNLVPAIAQDYRTKEIYMQGYVNQLALDEAVKTGYATFWSRKRKELWTKGKTSGDLLKIIEIRIDCDQDSIIYLIKSLGHGTCHTKNAEGKTRKSCFYRRIVNGKLEFIE